MRAGAGEGGGGAEDLGDNLRLGGEPAATVSPEHCEVVGGLHRQQTPERVNDFETPGFGI